MNRIQLAQYSLIASAFVIAALILFQVSQQTNNQAHAGMVVNNESIIMLTAAQDVDNGILYALDNHSQVLTAYTLDVNRGGNIIPLGQLNVGAAFGSASTGGSTTRRAR